MLAIRLDKELEARLAEAAKRAGRTKTAFAREAIASRIDALEELAAAEAALHEAYREGGQRYERIKEVLAASSR
jgi:RHH-type transcriptional regulator, rel operon repressor / antitoxin RelB